MKNKFTLAIPLIVLFCACEKVENISEKPGYTTKGLVEPDKPTVCCRSYETSIQSDGSTYCCVAGSGCAPCVVIEAPGGGGIKGANHLAMVNDLLGEEPAEVAAFFNERTNFQDIFPLLYGTEIHHKLCTGYYVLSNIVQAYRSNNCVFVFTNTTDNTHVAVPYAEE